ncbi:MAG: DUF1738 domain-containing protein [Deltaproteobacteria bacterium]|nr:MAG: DUF1738 domain-containing protein [Deltaproteobacteria bacterium]
MSTIYSEFTQHIIDGIREGASTWKMPWHTWSRVPINAVTGYPYRGSNFFLLARSGRSKNFETGEWATFKQWKSMEPAHVRKGEKSAKISVPSGRPDRRTLSEKEREQKYISSLRGEEDTSLLPGGNSLKFRTASVFNAEQVEGYTPRSLPVLDDARKHQLAESFVQKTGAEILYGKRKAAYIRNDDLLHMPPIQNFEWTRESSSTENFYSTLLHELVHWTGHSSRLNRDFGNDRNSEEYAFEELVAELGATFLCMQLQIEASLREDHVAYIDSWINILDRDEKAIRRASSLAQKAVDFLDSFQDESLFMPTMIESGEDESKES